MTARILQCEKSSRPDNENTSLVPELTLTSGTNTGGRGDTERIPNSDDVQDLGVGSQSKHVIQRRDLILAELCAALVTILIGRSN